MNAHSLIDAAEMAAVAENGFAVALGVNIPHRSWNNPPVDVEVDVVVAQPAADVVDDVVEEVAVDAATEVSPWLALAAAAVAAAVAEERTAAAVRGREKGAWGGDDVVAYTGVAADNTPDGAFLVQTVVGPNMEPSSGAAIPIV